MEVLEVTLRALFLVTRERQQISRLRSLKNLDQAATISSPLSLLQGCHQSVTYRRLGQEKFWTRWVLF